MNILVIITGLELGGAETQVSQMCDQLAINGHNICLIAMMGKIDISPLSGNISIHSLNMRKNISSIVESFKKTLKIIDEFSPDIIHSHLFHANIFSRILKLTRWGVTLVNTEHSKYIGSWLRKKIYQLTRGIPNATTNVSNEALENFIINKAFRHENSYTIYNGIDVERFSFSTESRERVRSELSISQEKKVFLAIGRLVSAKDYPNLLKSFSIIDSDNVELLIIGGGEEFSAIQCLINELNLTEKVRLLGVISNVEDYISACDIFVLSSAWEGFGLVVAEAMSCERIVVVTDAGGVKEVVGDCGFIAPIKSSSELAYQLSRALSLPKEDAIMMQKKARSRIEEVFSLELICNKWLDLYNRLLLKKN